MKTVANVFIPRAIGGVKLEIWTLTGREDSF